MRRATAAVLMGVGLIAVGGPVLGGNRIPIEPAPTLQGLAMALSPDSEDAAIRRAFRGSINREPTPSELRRYRVLMEEYQWQEADVRRDLNGRDDYRRYSKTGRSVRPDAVVQRAYQDIFGRDPDADGMRMYRGKMIDEGWSEQDVREALRRSDEYSSTDRRTASADRIVRRAYQDILHREPDPGGLETYRRNIVQNGWDEHDVRQALQRSPERRDAGAARVGGAVRATVSDGEATQIVRRAYLSVLNREPDEAGLREYKARVLRDQWGEQDVVRTLRNSDEYRSRHQ